MLRLIFGKRKGSCRKCVNDKICGSIIDGIVKKHQDRIYEDLKVAIPAEIGIHFLHGIKFKKCGNYNEKQHSRGLKT